MNKPHIITLVHPREQRKVQHWRIVAGVLGLLCLYVLMGKLDSDARLAEAERLAQLQAHQPRLAEAKPPVALQRQAAVNHACGGVL